MGRGSFANRGGGSGGGAKMEITANSSINNILNVLNNTNVTITSSDIKTIGSVLYNNVNNGDVFTATLGNTTHTYTKTSKAGFSDDSPFFQTSYSPNQMAQMLVDFTGLGWKVSYKAK